MTTQVQIRRGTTAEHSTFIGAVGEITVDTDKKAPVVHDGATAGGFPLLRQDLNNIVAGSVTPTMGGLGFDASGVVDGDFIVGTGAGTFGLESGATVRTSLGLGTGDSPTFAGAVINGTLFINEDANAKMTGAGITITQDAGNNSEILALKSGNIAHAMTNVAEADTFALFKKANATAGGLVITAFSETDASGINLQGGTTTSNTTKTNAGKAIVIAGGGKDNAGGNIGVPDANANIFAVSAASVGLVFIVDKEGDLFADSGTASTDMVTLFDGDDDPMLCRAFDLKRAEAGGAEGQLVRNEWDKWAREHQARLIELGVVYPDGPEGARGLVNITQLQRLHNGAICQLNIRDHVIVEVLEQEMPGFLAKVNAALEAANQRPILLR